MKKFYKVTDLQLKSINNTGNRFCVQYIINKWVKPVLKYSKLFVFNDIKQIKLLQQSQNIISTQYRLFECEVKNPRKALVVCSCNLFLEDFWTSRHQKQKMPLTRMPTPKGTYQVDAVKLTREIT